MNLTDEEIRIKVAESLGAKWHSVLTTPKIEKLVLAFRQWTDLGANRWDLPDGRVLSHDVPNYPLDLNACAEFETLMVLNDLGRYHTILCDLVEELYKDNPNIIPGYSRSMAISATAHQRCLAYLKTKGILP